MNEWLKKVFSKAKDSWSKWKPVQKVILIATVLIIIIVIIATARVSSKPSMIRLFSSPVTDQVNLSKILDRINRENIDVESTDGFIYVSDQATKTRLTALLNDEGLIPSNIDIWADYFDRSWSTTDADQNVKLQVKKQQELENFINSYEGILSSKVTITIPEDKLFTEDQNPVKCSVILRAKSNSNILIDKKRIHSLHNAILAAVDGLTSEMLVITDVEGNSLNDFESMADSDAVDVTEKQQRQIVKREAEYLAKVRNALESIYTKDRVNDLNVSITMDQSKESYEVTEYLPFVLKEDNPDTPYDDSEIKESVPISVQTVTKEYEQTGFNPEGPAGIDGQNPPVYSDMSNVIGHSTETGVTQNNAIGTKQSSVVKAPSIQRVSVGVNIDGTWALKRNAETKKYELDDEGWRLRIYTPLTDDTIKEIKELIHGVIDHDDKVRPGKISVTNLPRDRTEEFHKADEEYFAKERRTTTIILSLIAIVVVLVGFILFRVISKEIERRRREKEARLLAEQQAARERALWDAKDEGLEVTMSVEETRRMELQENAITMAKEHPEDVAMLIRTWLMEE